MCGDHHHANGFPSDTLKGPYKTMSMVVIHLMTSCHLTAIAKPGEVTEDDDANHLRSGLLTSPYLVPDNAL